jgi:metal-responsive CopG/Arc/MetJ family transcriptional regulator
MPKIKELQLWVMTKQEVLHLNETDNRKEVKRKFALWIKESTLDMVENIYKEDNCGSRSEFIEKAIIFYIGYLSSNDNSQYLPNILTSTLKSIVAESDNRMNRMIFKLAVELAMTMNVVAATQNIDKELLNKLRGECVKEVKRLNGSFSLDDAYNWQKG